MAELAHSVIHDYNTALEHSYIVRRIEQPDWSFGGEWLPVSM